MQSVVRKHFCQILIGYTLVVAIGWHWALLQSVAWVGMLANNARQCSLTEAIEKTFDGQHPCALCKVVQEGKQDEKKPTLLKVETKLDLLLAPANSFLAAPRPAAYPCVEDDALQSWFESPPTPPPRLT